MPTDNEVNAAKPTDSDANASPEVLALTAEQLEAHPHVQELKKKYSAAHQDMDKTNLSRKELQAEVARLKVLAGEEETPVKTEEPQYVTKKDLEEQRFDLLHSKDIELYGDEEFQKDVTNGIPKEYALNTAKLRFQSNPDKVRLERQQQMASGTASGTRNLQSDDITEADRRGMALFGYSEEAVRIQKKLKRERGH